MIKISSLNFNDYSNEISQIQKSLDDIKSSNRDEFYKNRNEINQLVSANREEINKTLRETNLDSKM
ncbi:MAG TPA: hypothetical protein PLG90_04815 [Ignavibacteria bacterium]|nr:hypothetical protein [Ignavibacteria bacterium]